MEYVSKCSSVTRGIAHQPPGKPRYCPVCPPQIVLSHTGGEVLGRHVICGSMVARECTPANSIGVGSTVFARLTVVTETPHYSVSK